uniref:Uncharacterized protein n=1 Tax=Monopterus albus TaxID=43700 RepID=A0A3Q3J8L3_MONAL
IEAIISAAETGFMGSLVGSNIPYTPLTRPAAYMGTMTGCFLCPRLTMFRVSMPRQQSSALLQWEPPHCCVHTRTAPGWGLSSRGSSRIFKDTTLSSSTRAVAD